MEEIVSLTEAGTLKKYAFSCPAATITHLTLTGTIDARDVQFMRDKMDVLEVLDLSDTTIVAYTGTEGTNMDDICTYPADEMPMHSFYYTISDSGKSSLASIDLPFGLKSLGDWAFAKCRGLDYIPIFPSSLTSIGEGTFACSGLFIDNPIFPSNLTSIGLGAFLGCRGLFGELTLPPGLTFLGEGAFVGCSELTSVSLPSGLSSIEKNAFMLCSHLIEVINLNYIPMEINADVFEGVDISACALKVPAPSVFLYKVADVWKDFMISSVTREES
jgi:hypothetical protein